MSQGGMSELSGVSAHSGDFRKSVHAVPLLILMVCLTLRALRRLDLCQRVCLLCTLSGSWITSHGQSLMWSTHELIDHVLDSEAVLYEGGEALAEPLTVAVSARR
jgi:hypothetical protein